MVDAVEHLALQGIDVDAHADEQLCRRALRLLEQGEQDVLRADVVVAERLCLLDRPLHDALGARRVVGIVGRVLCVARDHGLDALHDRVKGQSSSLQRREGDTALFVQQAEQDVLRPDIILFELARGVLSELNRLDGAAREMIAIVHFWFS